MPNVPNNPDAPEVPVDVDQLVADALERAATDLLYQAKALDDLPMADVYRRSALAVTAMRTGLSRTPAAMLTAAVGVARSRYDGADVLAARILAGDAEALREGERWQREANDAAHALHRFERHDSYEVEDLLGVAAVVEAVLIATGEQPSDDPEVNERFKPARLEWHRRFAERILNQLDRAAPGEDEPPGLRAQCFADLELIAAGVEPQ